MGAGEFEAGLQMLNGHQALLKVDVWHGESDNLRYAAAQMGEQPNEQAISQIAGDLLQAIYLGRIEICLGRHACSGNMGSASARLSWHALPAHLNASPVAGSQGYGKSQRV